MNIGKGSESFAKFKLQNVDRVNIDEILSQLSTPRDTILLDSCCDMTMSSNTTDMFLLYNYATNVSTMVHGFEEQNSKVISFMEVNADTVKNIATKIVAFIKELIVKIKEYFVRTVKEFGSYQEKFSRVVDELNATERTPLTDEQLTNTQDVAVVTPQFIQIVSRLLATQMPTTQSVKEMYEGSVSTEGAGFTINTEKLNAMVESYRKFKSDYDKIQQSDQSKTTFDKVTAYHSVGGIMSSVYTISDIKSQVDKFNDYVKDVIGVFTALTNKSMAIDYNKDVPSSQAVEVQKSMQLVIAYMKLIDNTIELLYTSMIHIGVVFLKAKRVQQTNP